MKQHCPAVICWRITSQCNRSCPFCFRPEACDLDTRKVYKIIDSLARQKIQGMGITGGEPLLRKDIAGILRYIWEKNIKICLATNADFYGKYQKVIDKYVSAVGLPVEGSKEKIHDSLRGKGSFCNVTRAMEAIHKKGRPKMYFSTVLTKNNLEDLVNIENLLAKYQKALLYWKIYGVINYPDRPRQLLRNNALPQEKVKKVLAGLGSKLGKKRIFYLSPQDRSQASLIINPDGTAIVPVDKNTKTKDNALGSFLKDGADEIFGNWDKAVDYKKYLCHKCALRCLGL